MSLTEAGSQNLARMDSQQALPRQAMPAFLVLALQVHVIVSGFSSKRVVAQRRYWGLNFYSCVYIESTVLLSSLSSSGIFFLFLSQGFSPCVAQVDLQFKMQPQPRITDANICSV